MANTIVMQLVVDGQVAAVAAMEPKDFSTGSKGFYGQLRPVIDGRKYIASVNLVEVGSKAANGNAAPAPAKGKAKK